MAVKSSPVDPCGAELKVEFGKSGTSGMLLPVCLTTSLRPWPAGRTFHARQARDSLSRRRPRPGRQGDQFRQSARCRRPGRSGRALRGEGADELVFLDITASHEGRDIMLDVVRRTAEVIFMPLTRRRRHPHARRHSRLAAGRLRQGVDQLGRRRRIPSSSARPPGGSAASASW